MEIANERKARKRADEAIDTKTHEGRPFVSGRRRQSRQPKARSPSS
jgi:hypothetical protein